MKTAFITGAAGFLGSHLVDEMLGSGYRVMGYDNLSHGNLRNLEQARLHPRFSFHQGDVCDRNAIRKAVGSKIDVVLHLAAFKIPRYGNVTDTLLINSDGTLNVLQLAVEHGAKFVITSTSDVYGKNPVVPFSEESDSILGPPTISRWAYAASKLFDEHLVLAMSEEKGIPATVIRIFGSYGPRQNLSWWGGPQAVFIGTARSSTSAAMSRSRFWNSRKRFTGCAVCRGNCGCKCCRTTRLPGAFTKTCAGVFRT